MKSVLAFGDSNTWGLIPGTKERYSWEIGRSLSAVERRLSSHSKRERNGFLGCFRLCMRR